jgi:phosphoenolpyruvate carboxykinase (ATP)
VGRRIPIATTRQIVSDVLQGKLETVEYRRHPLLNLDIPVDCCDAPKAFLDPKDTWEDKAAYDLAARKLAGMFIENFKKFKDAPAEVVAAGPRPE